ncbi:MAG: hypothetical protein MSH46_06175, partial [Oscillospiraceae bacterium]|nr:hypothetical protein [Oscillospiraceae bacterium]
LSFFSCSADISIACAPMLHFCRKRHCYYTAKHGGLSIIKVQSPINVTVENNAAKAEYLTPS